MAASLAPSAKFSEELQIISRLAGVGRLLSVSITVIAYDERRRAGDSQDRGKAWDRIDRLLTSPRLLGDQRHRQRGLIRLPSTVTLDGLP